MSTKMVYYTILRYPSEIGLYKNMSKGIDYKLYKKNLCTWAQIVNLH